ncbi:MAG: hypothetical protein Fues2KO_46820 [Fuerstiella sp.]
MTHSSVKGWSVKRLKELIEFTNGKAHENCIDEEGRYVVVNSKFVSTNGQVRKHSSECRLPLQTGDVAIVMSDIPNGRALARCFYVTEDETYTLNQRIGLLRATCIQAKYLYYALDRNQYFLRFDDGVGQTNLRKDEVLACPVNVPPPLEQKKIADVLSTWDKAIELTERLLATKQKRKHELIGQLLTGTLRLPGFENEEIAVCSLSDLVSSRPGNGKLIKGRHSDVPRDGLVQGFSASGPDVWVPDAEYETPGVVVSAVGARCGKSFYAEGQWTAIANTHVLLPTENSLAQFVWYVVNDEQFWIKGGSAQPFVKIKASMNLKVRAPSLAYQSAIVQFLNLLERELELLQRRAILLSKQRRGLMQQLLTGKVRVNVDAETVKG